MSHDLHERLDDLVTDVPVYVVPDARAAWSAGARRRTRHRVVVGAAALVVLVVLASAVSWLPRTFDHAPADGGRSGVQGYPSRIDKPWIMRDLPDRPGPVAGIVLADDGFDVVSGTGRVWRLSPLGLAGDTVALSADGTGLAYFRSRGVFVIQDLLTGEADVADGVGDGSTDPKHPKEAGRFWAQGQTPAFWSPVADRIFVMGGRVDNGPGRALVIARGGATRAVQAPRVRGERLAWPAGWTPSGGLVWLAADYRTDGGDVRWAYAVLTDTSGRVLTRVRLDVPRGLTDMGQWSGSISPGGTRLAVVGQDGKAPAVFSMEDGSLITRSPDIESTCPVPWQADEPGDEVAVDPAFHATCTTWAADALDGHRHRGLSGLAFGDRDTWIAWHWQAVLLPVLVGAAIVLLFVRRRRRALAPTS